ncbi:MAG: cytochrome c oxidase subunit 3 [Candidatus Rokuibacteriota bacterium]
MSVLDPVVEAPPERPDVVRMGGPALPPPPDDSGGDGWGRGPSREPRGFDNLRLGVLVFIGAECMFFATLISALFVLRLGIAAWPPPLEPRLPVVLTGINTVVLLASSVAVAAAMRSLRRGERRRLVRRLGIAALLGTLFLAVQGSEWIRLVGFGLTLASGVYGLTFYTLIGFHALHVFGAVVWLSAIAALAARGRLGAHRASPVKACAMYWHFVVGLWPILYVAVYLL